jgi:acetyl esterase/lipase
MNLGGGGALHGDLDDGESGPAAGTGPAWGPFELPAGARVVRNLGYGSDPAQRLDVYFPARSPGPARAAAAPVMFMVHGGGWCRGNKALWRVVKNKVAHWVGAGGIFVSTNYRLLPAADPLTQANDVAAALAYVQSHLRAWGGNAERVVVMGHSAGAHLVLLIATDAVLLARPDAAPWFAMILLDSAAMDVEEIMNARHYPLYDQAFGRDPDYWRQASPLHRLTQIPPAPMLIVCSTQRPDSCPQARAFAAKVQGYGGRADLLPVDLSHGEINELLGADNAYTAAVDAFLRSLDFAATGAATGRSPPPSFP